MIGERSEPSCGFNDCLEDHKNQVFCKKAFISSLDASKWTRGLRLLDGILEKYEFLEKLGEGSYGMVMKAKNKATGMDWVWLWLGELAAVKLIKKKTPDEFKDTISEVSLLKNLVI